MHWTLAAQHGDTAVIVDDAAGEVSGTVELLVFVVRGLEAMNIAGEVPVLVAGGLEVVSDVAAIVGGEVTVLDLGHVG